MSKDIANQLFLAYMGRPADAGWRTSTANLLNNAAPSVALQNAFYSAAVLEGVYSLNDSSATLVNKIFLNIFGFAARTDEQVAWGNLISNGTITAQTAAWTIFSSYLGATNVPDAYKTPTQSKLVAMDAYVTELGNNSAANIAVSQLGSTGASAARSFLSGVTSAATAATAITGIAATVSGVSTSQTGSAFNLTTGVDNLTGTSSNDTFTADNTGAAKQYTVADTINGGSGSDTLRIFQAAADTPHTLVLSNLNSVEGLYLNGGTLTAAQTFDVSGVSGLTSVAIDSPSAVLADGSTYTVRLASTTSLALTKVIGTAGGATSTVAINGGSGVTLNGVTTDVTLDLTSNGTSLSLATTGAASTVTLANTGGALATLTVTGDRALTLTEGLTQLRTINASAATGAVAVDLSSITQNSAFSFTGGSGADRLTFAGGALTSANLASGGQIDFGAGTDTLVVKDAAPVTATINAMKGLEVLQLGVDAASVSMSALTSVKTVAVGGFATAAVSNMAADSVVNIVGAMTTSVTVGGAIGVNTGTINVGVAGSAGFTVASLVTTGLTNIALSSSGTSANTITAMTNSENSSFTITGSADLSMALTAGATVSGSRIDATAFTGKLTATGTDQADIIIGGTVNDTLTGGKGADRLTGGAGADTFSFAATTGAVTSGITVGDEITDFVVGTDKLQFTGVTDVVSAQQNAVQTAVNALAPTATAAQIATAMATANTTNLGVSFAVFGGSTYVYYETTGTATGVANDDVFIKLTGVSTLPTFAGDVIA